MERVRACYNCIYAKRIDVPLLENDKSWIKCEYFDQILSCDSRGTSDCPYSPKPEKLNREQK